MGLDEALLTWRTNDSGLTLFSVSLADRGLGYLCGDVPYSGAMGVGAGQRSR